LAPLAPKDDGLWSLFLVGARRAAALTRLDGPLMSQQRLLPGNLHVSARLWWGSATENRLRFGGLTTHAVPWRHRQQGLRFFQRPETQEIRSDRREDQCARGRDQSAFGRGLARADR